MSLKLRLLLIVSGLTCMSTVAGLLYQAHNWKAAIRSEIDSSFSLVQHLFGKEALTLSDSYSFGNIENAIDALQSLRHIRVIVKYDYDKANSENEQYMLLKDAGVPEWFVRFIKPYEDQPPTVRIFGTELFSQIAIEADPSDEIIEVWEDFQVQLYSMLLFSLIIIVLSYIALHIGLKPLNKLLAGFQKLEESKFNVALDLNVVSELSRINQKFNHMVDVLKRTSEDNALLTRKLVSLQEDERRSITHELHDEMAPHLFGIRAINAKVNSLLTEGKVEQAMEKLSEIDIGIEELQQQTRNLLTKLRPMILDDLDMQDALLSLVKSNEVHDLGIDWNINMSGLDDLSDDTVKVTLYRIVQECVSNIVQHAHASIVNISVSINQVKEQDERCLLISVVDNGIGIQEGISNDFGIIGMRERVQALGGRFSLNSSPGKGVKIIAEIPVED